MRASSSPKVVDVRRRSSRRGHRELAKPSVSLPRQMYYWMVTSSS